MFPHGLISTHKRGGDPREQREREREVLPTNQREKYSVVPNPKEWEKWSSLTIVFNSNLLVRQSVDVIDIRLSNR